MVTDPRRAGCQHGPHSGKNVGDLLNAKNITWGWFQGGFAPTGSMRKAKRSAAQHHAGLAGDDAVDNQSATTFRTTNRSNISPAL